MHFKSTGLAVFSLAQRASSLHSRSIPVKSYLICVPLIILALAFGFLTQLSPKGFENGTMKANLLKRTLPVCVEGYFGSQMELTTKRWAHYTQKQNLHSQKKKKNHFFSHLYSVVVKKSPTQRGGGVSVWHDPRKGSSQAPDENAA